MHVLRKGENIALPSRPVHISLSSADGVHTSVVLLPADTAATSVAQCTAGVDVGCRGIALNGPTVRISCADVPDEIQAVLCLATLQPHTSSFGVAEVRIGTDDADIAVFTVCGTSTERAIVTVEVYRRHGGWRLRAVGQGRPEGLDSLLATYGIRVQPAPDDLVPVAHASAILEDAARSTLAFRSTVNFAERRRDDALGALAAQSGSSRHQEQSIATDRIAAQCTDLIDTATRRHQHDVADLSRDVAELAGCLPASTAAWDSPAWSTCQPPAEGPCAIRVGEVRVAEAADLPIPLLLPMPPSAPVWFDTEHAGGPASVAMLRGLIVRAMVAGEKLPLIDIVELTDHPQLVPAMSRLMAGEHPSVRAVNDLPSFRTLLDDLTVRADLIQMARSGDAMDALDDSLTCDRLLIVHDFPVVCDRDIFTAFRTLVGKQRDDRLTIVVTAPTGGVRADPLLEMLFSDFICLPLCAGGVIRDPWIGLDWTFYPDLAPAAAVEQAMSSIAARAGS